MPKLNADRCRALALLADSTIGRTEVIMLAHGFGPTLIAWLVGAGLVRTEPDRIRAGARLVQVTRGAAAICRKPK